MRYMESRKVNTFNAQVSKASQYRTSLTNKLAPSTYPPSLPAQKERKAREKCKADINRRR